MMTLAGLGAGAGITCVLVALAPKRPDLRAALDTDRASRQHGRTAEEDRGERRAWSRLAARMPRFDGDRAAALTRLPHRDLELLGRTPAAHGVRKLVWASIGLLLPSAAVALLALLGVAVPFAVTAGAVLAAGATGFVLPDVDARARVEDARSRLRHAVNAYLVLVALEYRAGPASQQAFNQAARVADTWMFRRIRSALDRARLQRRPAWEGLRDLAEQVEVGELADCADIMATSADGGAVADALLARARGLRGEALSHRRGRADKASERMAVPVAALGLCFAALLVYPAVAGLLAA